MAQVLKDDIKNKIIESAIDIFTTNGFKGASIKDIAKMADISVGNVYNYFPSKEALYQSVISGVYEGIHEILKKVEATKNYEYVLNGGEINKDFFNPMIYFMDLYQKEKLVFNMLLKNGRDKHYNETIQPFIELLSVYFLRFWGEKNVDNGLTNIEVSALTNAIVFSVIDLINLEEEDQLETSLVVFVTRMVKGYFIAKRLEAKKI